MNLLALDMSTKSTGYAIYKHNKLILYNYITATSNDLFNRIKVMLNAINKILSLNLDLLYVIMLEVRQEGKFINVKTYKALMYLQGCLQMIIHEKFKHLRTDFMYPSLWRRVCKIKQGPEIKRPQQKLFDIDWVKNNFQILVNDDVADAIGLGYGYINK